MGLRVLILLFILGSTVYANVLAYPFVHDDVVFILQNPHIRDLADWPSMFIRSSAGGDGLSVVNPYYRPLLEFFYRLEYRLFGFQPAGYHGVNILLHIINAFLVFRLFRRVLGHGAYALATALVFLLHPVQSEAVSCVSGISNLLFAFLVLLGFELYAAALRSKSRTLPRVLWMVMLSVLFASALLVKEQSVIFPFLLGWALFCFSVNGKEREFARYGGVFGLLVALTLAYLGLRKMLFGGSLVPVLDYQNELVLRLLSIPQALLMYLRILVVPFDLHYYRSLDILTPWLPSALGLAVVAAGIWAVSRQLAEDRRRWFIFGLGWGLISLLPTLNIIPLIHEYSRIAAFDHFLYLPLAGFSLAVLVVLEHFFRRATGANAERGMKMAGVGVLGVFAVMTFVQNRTWRSETALFEQAVRFEKGLGRLQALLGRAYYFDGKYPQAVEQLSSAASIMEGYLAKVKDEGAVEFYRHLLREIRFDLAHCYEALNDWPQALAQYRQVLIIADGSGAVYNNIGTVHVQLNDLVSAQAAFREAVRLDPRDFMAMNNLAICLIRQGELAQAETMLEAALAIDPGFAAARNNLEQLRRQMSGGQ